MEIAGRARRLGREQVELHWLPQVTVYELWDCRLGGVKKVSEREAAAIRELEVRVVYHELEGVDDRASVTDAADTVLSAWSAARTPEFVALLGECKHCLTEDGFVHHPFLEVNLEVRDGAAPEWISTCVVWVAEDRVATDVSVAGNRSSFGRAWKSSLHGLPIAKDVLDHSLDSLLVWSLVERKL
jgi:hypothetical protein